MPFFPFCASVVLVFPRGFSGGGIGGGGGVRGGQLGVIMHGYE